MNFLLSNEQVQLQESLTRRLQESCGSRELHAFIDGTGGYDRELWGQLASSGLLGITAPETFGGAGLDLIDLALIVEVLGRFAAPVPMLGQALATLAVQLGGSEDQKREWLPPLTAGSILGTVAFAEADASWEPGDWRVGGANLLQGRKLHVPNAIEADMAVVGIAGGSLALVDLRERPMQRTRTGGADLTRPLDEITFDGAGCEPLPVAGAAETVRDAALVLLAADAFGGASRCVEMAVNYANQREQFGVSISQFQAIRHQLANMALQVEPCRGLYWYAAHAFDHLPNERSLAAAQAKSHVCEQFLQVARENIEIHGGVGYTWEYDPHIWLKRAIFDWSWAGNPMSHRRRAADLAGW